MYEIGLRKGRISQTLHESGQFIEAKLAKPSLDLQKAVIDEAHKHGLIVVAHSTCPKNTEDFERRQ
ncbi:hypothetical protein M433DRAFT_153421 [Acidomyces richmondensis BFW]|nr:MAG: hypothetical protein FE78DRAFT_89062 [Acidomyces sp. 'richmondensis']KYG46404.1 hypothetical protein M433DRAFT_153421 [Acidomyces richmondensis BFW]